MRTVEVLSLLNSKHWNQRSFEVRVGKARCNLFRSFEDRLGQKRKNLA